MKKILFSLLLTSSCALATSSGARMNLTSDDAQNNIHTQNLSPSHGGETSLDSEVMTSKPLKVQHEPTQVALRCFDWLKQDVHNMKNGGSGVCMASLLRDITEIFEDQSHLFGTSQDAFCVLIRELYDFHQDYTLNEHGDDLCPMGNKTYRAASFKKLIEGLTDIRQVLTDRNSNAGMMYATTQTASFKMPIAIREEAQKYIQSLKGDTKEALKDKITNPETEEEELNALISAIKPAVTKRMLDEFQILYQDDQDPAFQELLSQGILALDPEALIVFCT